MGTKYGRVPCDSYKIGIALTRPSCKSKLQTHSLVREGATKQETGNYGKNKGEKKLVTSHDCGLKGQTARLTVGRKITLTTPFGGVLKYLQRNLASRERVNLVFRGITGPPRSWRI
jgi:hypothetical protein